MILVLNGPNLNLLGSREPEVYGRATLADLEAQCRDWGRALNLEVVCRQSNHEGHLIDGLHSAASDGFNGVVLNPGGFTHTSVALRDAVAGISLPVIEVHISNVHARESFRHHSYISAVAKGTIVGLGLFGYHAAIMALHKVNAQ